MKAIHSKAAPEQQAAVGHSQTLSTARRELIDACGRLSQIGGLPRSTGQIYGLLYFAVRPMYLDEIAETLQISKASASTGTRELAALNAIRVVWVQGDRKDHFEVEPDLANLFRAAYGNFIKPRVAATERRLNKLSTALDSDLETGVVSAEEHAIMAGRLKEFFAIQRKLHVFLALSEKLL